MNTKRDAPKQDGRGQRYDCRANNPSSSPPFRHACGSHPASAQPEAGTDSAPPGRHGRRPLCGMGGVGRVRAGRGARRASVVRVGSRRVEEGGTCGEAIEAVKTGVGNEEKVGSRPVCWFLRRRILALGFARKLSGMEPVPFSVMTAVAEQSATSPHLSAAAQSRLYKSDPEATSE